LQHVAEEIKSAVNNGVEVGVVIGGGNFFRGMSAAAADMDRVNADYIGMLATVMNALALRQALEHNGVSTRVQSALAMPEVAEGYIRGRALKHLKLKRVVVFAAGTGNPLFTTDSAASLRAIEINADIMLKATKVDGVYDADPMTNPNATRYDRLGYTQVINQRLAVMDATAITLCRDHDMPVMVFNVNQPGSLRRVLAGENIGTIVSGA
jgi:uridylate kinase